MAATSKSAALTRTITRLLIAAAAITTVGSVVQAQMASPEVPGLMGAIKDGSGKPMAGVTVTLRNVAQAFATSVHTDERGVYIFPHLAAGQYKVMAQAVGFSAAKADVALDGAHTGRQAFSLKPLAAYGQQLNGYEWSTILPEATPAQKRMKQVLYVACTGCHSLDVALQNRFDEKGWNIAIQSMENAFYNGFRPGDLSAAQLRWEGQVIRRHREELARYLAEARGPNSKVLPKPLARPTGDPARSVVTEYELPLKETQNDPSWFTGTEWELGPSVGMHGQVGIHDVIADANGKAWITQARETFETNRSVIKLDPKTGAMKVFNPRDARGRLAYFEQISEPDDNGNIWMHNGDHMVRLNPTTDTFDNWQRPQVMGGMGNSTDWDSRGRGVANARYGTVMFDPSELGRKDVAYPGWYYFQQNTPGDGTTYGISVDAHDNIWWSESYVDKVAMRDAKTGKVTEFDMIDPDYAARKALATPEDLTWYDSIGGGTWAINSASPLPYMNMPRRLAADKKGDKVWVPMWAQDHIASIDINTHAIKYYKLPFKTHPYKTTVDNDHNVWTDSGMANAAFRLNPTTGQWAMFPIPSLGCASRHMSYDRYKNEIWVPCDQSNKVVRFQFRTEAQLKALEAAATPAGTGK
ncbi:carboxypeptidase regulatory-like domain-containing protein [Novosphingobium flavum]|uniref:Carboxypeptidase regulatory-like domain-containing protein n=1 Tax=Novosphingobium flavum TaxID=1778672 RepID=A0A7X1KLF0_9SPHN|nr:carboxypeptidase regulatory-like domain-containing protein [Novosphingobium flavum]MBC2665517.1 carboxypeptidase regulatory-like domain-containing protein [Novosphingobium flavum]